MLTFNGRLSDGVLFVIVISDVDSQSVMSRQMVEAKWTFEDRSLSVRWIYRDRLNLRQEKRQSKRCLFVMTISCFAEQNSCCGKMLVS